MNTRSPRRTWPQLSVALISAAALFTSVDVQSQNPAGEPKDLSVDLGGGVRMDFVLISPGAFVMGSEKGKEDQKPLAKVTLTKPFYLGKFEVTQEQWQSIMHTNPSNWKGTNLPAERISWDDCQIFAAKLGEKVPGYRFSLPTEAQWEYACRAGTTTEYSCGDTDTNLLDFAWFVPAANRTTHPVGEKKPNPWGLHDIHGNVWEWCQDWYGPYPGGELTDPTGPATGSSRVIRGGSWSHRSSDLTSAFRLKFRSDFRFLSIGARMAAVPK